MPIELLNGIDLYYESHGEGPAIVFLHGAAGNHIAWWQQVPAFRDRYRCITIDHRGFGFSTDPRNEGGARFADDLDALLDRLEIERAALVAQSMGGRTALGFAVRHPERVPALVMADTWGFFEWPELQQRAQQLRDASPDERPLAERALGPCFQQQEPARTFLYRTLAGLNPPRDPQAAAATAPLTKAEVEALTVPTLFLVGSEDALAPPEILRAVHGIIRGSQYAEVPGCGHSVYWEHPMEFNRLVQQFLTQQGYA